MGTFDDFMIDKAVKSDQELERLRERCRKLERGLKQMLAYVDELEVDIGQEIRGVTYYEAKKLLE